jgi:hypothetical protein
MKNLSYLIIIILISACAKMPIESVTLAESIINEGERMHELNISLLNKMFLEKSTAIDVFIKEEYTPAFLENFKKRIPEGIDIEAELPAMLEAIVPKINERRDMMQVALESQRLKLIEKLNQDYKMYVEAATELKNLIESAVKVNEERQRAYEKAANLTGGKVDLNQIETELDKFILKAGDISSDAGTIISGLDSKINSLIKN